MSALIQQQDHFIIGLTGNIGTGKSVVRKMLQHLGAYGIDADALVQEALNNSAPAREQVLGRFGALIIKPDGAINRAALSEIVFNDTDALADLENILHPLVSTAAHNLIRRSRLPIVVIEAIKLLESDLVDLCDSIWVVNARERTIYDRLKKLRDMDHDQVRERLSSQSPSEKKIKRADVVINNDQDMAGTWQQIEAVWEGLRGRDGSFRKYADRSSELLLKINPLLMTPSSKFNDVEKNLRGKYQEGEIAWLTGKKISPFSEEQGIVRFIIDQFVFNHNENKYTIWDLTQFKITLLGYFPSDLMMVKADPGKILESIEIFGKLHLVREIIIPIKEHLNEGVSVLRLEGYEQLAAKSEDISRWSKAGYNVFQKKVREDFNLFSRENENQT